MRSAGHGPPRPRRLWGIDSPWRWRREQRDDRDAGGRLKRDDADHSEALEADVQPVDRRGIRRANDALRRTRRAAGSREVSPTRCTAGGKDKGKESSLLATLNL